MQGNTDVWLVDGARMTRVTFDAARDFLPIWSPESRRIVFSSDRTGATNLYQKSADGADTEDQLVGSRGEGGQRLVRGRAVPALSQP